MLIKPSAPPVEVDVLYSVRCYGLAGYVGPGHLGAWQSVGPTIQLPGGTLAYLLDCSVTVANEGAAAHTAGVRWRRLSDSYAPFSTGATLPVDTQILLGYPWRVEPDAVTQQWILELSVTGDEWYYVGLPVAVAWTVGPTGLTVPSCV